jgi:hypothetical protein
MSWECGVCEETFDNKRGFDQHVRKSKKHSNFIAMRAEALAVARAESLAPAISSVSELPIHLANHDGDDEEVENFLGATAPRPPATSSFLQGGDAVKFHDFWRETFDDVDDMETGVGGIGSDELLPAAVFLTLPTSINDSETGRRSLEELKEMRNGLMDFVGVRSEIELDMY